MEEHLGARSRTKDQNSCEKHITKQQGEDLDEEGNAATELRLTVRTLWKTGLEVFIHQILYRRRIFPRDTFCSTRFVGAECKINNNPDVLVYIAQALKNITPAIFGSDGDNILEQRNPHCIFKEIILEIYDQVTDVTYEQFSLSFISSRNEEDDITYLGLHSLVSNFCSSDQKGNISDYVIEEVENQLRDLVCSTGKLERPRSLVWDDSVSFKILLRIDQRTHGKSISLLDHCLDSNMWSKTTSTYSCRTGNRVLFHLSDFACQFQYRLTPSQESVTAGA